MHVMKKALSLLLIFLLLGSMAACMFLQPAPSIQSSSPSNQQAIDLWTAPPESESPVPLAEETAPLQEVPTFSPSDPDSPSPASTEVPTPEPTAVPTEPPVREDREYDQKEEVALYLHLFGHLPSNYITKKEAQALGWPGGDLSPYAPGKCIGGDWFGNYERLLPTKKGRSYYECDIDTMNRRSRGAKRIIYSNDGLIYYTDDHYESFTLLYEGD